MKRFIFLEGIVLATMKDVAARAGVSLGTVSKALNGDSSVKAANMTRIQEAIKSLGYRPNLTARALKTHITNSVALLIPDITNPYYPELARGAEDVANRLGLTLFMCNNDRDATKERRYVEQLLLKGVDGIVLVKTLLKIEELEQIRSQCELVLVDAEVRLQHRFDYVNVDDQQGSELAMQLLLQNGHTRIAYIQGYMHSESAQLRFHTYQKALSDRQILLDDKLVVQGRYEWQGGYDATCRLLKLEDRPTAIFAGNDIMAFGAIKALRDAKIDVPNDISVIGFDDISLSSYNYPQLTTIRQPKYEIGTTSMEILYKRITHELDEEKVHGLTLATSIIERETVTRAPMAERRQ